MITEPPPNPPLNPHPSAEPPRRGLSPLAWVGIGCGGLLLVGAIVGGIAITWSIRKAKEVVGDLNEFAQEMERNPAKAAAELVVKVNPNLELVESDEAAGTMTIREKSTGKVATFSFDEISEGTFRFETPEGEFEIQSPEGGEGAIRVTTPEGETTFGAGSMEQVPAWVALPEGAGSVTPLVHSTEGGNLSGSLRVKSDQRLEDLFNAYVPALEDAGYSVTVHRVDAGGELTQAVLSAEDKANSRNLAITATADGSGSSLLLNYSGLPDPE